MVHEFMDGVMIDIPKGIVWDEDENTFCSADNQQNISGRIFDVGLYDNDERCDLEHIVDVILKVTSKKFNTDAPTPTFVNNSHKIGFVVIPLEYEQEGETARIVNLIGAAHGDAEAEIIEIGAVKVLNGVVVDKFDELCNPGRKIVPRIARLTHITDDMVADKPSVDEIIKQFKTFVGDSILIGHNIKGCDIPHISRAAKRAGVSFENMFLDTKPLAKKHKDECGWRNVKLTTLSEYFGITQSEAHRAWCDAEANAYVYLKLKEF